MKCIDHTATQDLAGAQHEALQRSLVISQVLAKAQGAMQQQIDYIETIMVQGEKLAEVQKVALESVFKNFRAWNARQDLSLESFLEKLKETTDKQQVFVNENIKTVKAVHRANLVWMIIGVVCLLLVAAHEVYR